MESIESIPDFKLVRPGTISDHLTANGIRTFHQACRYVQQMPYADNERETDDILFLEGRGTCISKHRAMAVCAHEQRQAIYQVYGIYPLDESVVCGLEPILAPFKIPFVPAGHCFLAYKNTRIDLTEGNNNGKQRAIDAFLATARLFSYDHQLKDRLLDFCATNLIDFDPRFAHISHHDLMRAHDKCLDEMHRQRA